MALIVSATVNAQVRTQNVICRPVNNKTIYSRKHIKQVMKNVFDWQVANPMKVNDSNINMWARAAFYVGVIEAYETTGEKRYLDQAIAWGDSRDWKLGNRPTHADDHTPAQTFVEIYEKKKRPEMIAHTKEIFDQLQTVENKNLWWWCDALFMAPPALASMSRATGDKKYLEIMDRYWWKTTDELFDKEESLFFRDHKYKNRLTPSGKKIFWARGNGWVMAGLARVIERLPKNDPMRAKYVDQFQRMAQALVKLQQPDGYWRPSLLDPQHVPLPETSGTAFFTYALAWGINNKILDRKTFLPVVNRAWMGLNGAVNQDGSLGWVQKIGASPEKVSARDHQEYGSGAFLLAGSEMYKL
jgi:unsaturated rhamnogalacturonyl hydrolase